MDWLNIRTTLRSTESPSSRVIWSGCSSRSHAAVAFRSPVKSLPMISASSHRAAAAYSIEPLEARIAPATLLNPTTVTYQDADGDDVTVKFSKPVLVAGDFAAVFHFDSAGA